MYTSKELLQNKIQKDKKSIEDRIQKEREFYEKVLVSNPITVTIDYPNLNILDYNEEELTANKEEILTPKEVKISEEEAITKHKEDLMKKEYGLYIYLKALDLSTPFNVASYNN